MNYFYFSDKEIDLKQLKCLFKFIGEENSKIKILILFLKIIIVYLEIKRNIKFILFIRICNILVFVVGLENFILKNLNKK